MTVFEYKAVNCIIPLIRSKGLNLEDVQKEIQYRKAHITEHKPCENQATCFITLNELVDAEKNWTLA